MQVRIHVERCIGLLKNKYTILLKGTLPICLVKNDGNTQGSTGIDKVLIVRSALTNSSYQQVFYLNNMSVIPILFCVT